MHRLTNSTLNRPSEFEPAPNEFRCKTEVIGYVHDAASEPESRHNAGSSRISFLLGIRGPSTVLFAVITVVINSINRKAGRTFSHILKKCGKCVPFRTNTNTPSAVIGIVLHFGIVASLLHICPNLVSLGSAQSMLVDERRFTPTRLGELVGKVITSYDFSVTAVAEAKPVRVTGFYSGKVLDEQASKPLSDERESVRHGSLSSKLFVFNGGRSAPTDARRDLDFAIKTA